METSSPRSFFFFFKSLKFNVVLSVRLEIINLKPKINGIYTFIATLLILQFYFSELPKLQWLQKKLEINLKFTQIVQV